MKQKLKAVIQNVQKCVISAVCYNRKYSLPYPSNYSHMENDCPDN